MRMVLLHQLRIPIQVAVRVPLLADSVRRWPRVEQRWPPPPLLLLLIMMMTMRVLWMRKEPVPIKQPGGRRRWRVSWKRRRK